MFGNRGAALLDTIRDEKARLSCTAQITLNGLLRAAANNQAGFAPILISDVQYRTLTNGERLANDHEKRIYHILWATLKYAAMSRSVPEKLKDFFLKNKEVVAALGIPQLAIFCMEHYGAIHHLFQPILGTLFNSAEESSWPPEHEGFSQRFSPASDPDVEAYLETLSEEERDYLRFLSSDLTHTMTEEKYADWLAQPELEPDLETGG